MTRIQKERFFNEEEYLRLKNRYILDEESIDKKKNIEGVIVNFASLEDWAVAYTIMNDPKNRMPILNNYFSNNGIKNTKLVERYLDKDLPEKTKQKIKEIIK